MWNTIILRYGERFLTDREYKKFQKGDCIFGIDCASEELKRWPIEQKEEALEELNKHRCDYGRPGDRRIEEYALEYCECDEDGEFVCGFCGSDYDFAPEI